MVARLLWDKGVGEFVEAATIIKQGRPDIRFQLLGPIGVENRTAIAKEQVAKWLDEGVIEYLGESDSVQSIMSEAHAIVLPSYREGTSRVLLEGAAIGRPLIATNVPGCREIIEDGVTGYLCAPRDALDLAEKINTILSLSTSQLEVMGRKGREKVVREFRQEIVCDRYVEVLKQEC